MPFGIQIQNDNSFTQIDGERQNYTVKARGTFATTATEGVGVAGPSWNKTTEKLFVRPPFDVLIGRSDSGGWFTTGTTGNVWLARTVEYIIFQKASAQAEPTSGYGMNIYDDTGAFVWGMDHQNMNIAGQMSSPAYQGVPFSDAVSVAMPATDYPQYIDASQLGFIFYLPYQYAQSQFYFFIVSQMGGIKNATTAMYKIGFAYRDFVVSYGSESGVGNRNIFVGGSVDD